MDGKRGQVVVYVTSVQAVRSTYEECRQVVQILRNMRVAFQQKDIFLHPDYRKELMERLVTDKPIVPQVSICHEYHNMHTDKLWLLFCAELTWQYCITPGIHKRPSHWSESIDVSLLGTIDNNCLLIYRMERQLFR